KDDGTAAAPVSVTWKSLRPDIASVDQNGVIVALAPGQGTVQVTSTGGLTATAPVVVQQSDVAVQEPVPLVMSPGDVDTLHVTVKFTVQGLAVDKTPVPEAQFRWTVADTSLAGFDPASGTLTGKRVGKTALTVKGPGPGLTVTWPIRVIAAGLKLSASRLGVPLARRVPLRASFADESGAVIGPATGVTWASDNPSVAT